MYFEFQAEPRQGATWTPAVDVCERDTEIIIFVETPGVDRADLQLSWNDGVLIISGHKRQEPPDRKMAVNEVWRERCTQIFCELRSYLAGAAVG